MAGYSNLARCLHKALLKCEDCGEPATRFVERRYCCDEFGGSADDLPTAEAVRSLSKKRPVTLGVRILVGSSRGEIAHGNGEIALTTAEAAGRLDISLSSFRFLMRDELISPCANLAKALLFKESDVEMLRLERARQPLVRRAKHRGA